MWIAKKVYKRAKISASIATCLTQLNAHSQQLGFAMQIDVYTAVGQDDGSAVGDLKEYMEQQSQHQDEEMLGIISVLQESAAHQTQHMQAFMQHALDTSTDQLTARLHQLLDGTQQQLQQQHVTSTIASQHAHDTSTQHITALLQQHQHGIQQQLEQQHVVSVSQHAIDTSTDQITTMLRHIQAQQEQ